MSRYICFTNLKHLIFKNRGSTLIRIQIAVHMFLEAGPAKLKRFQKQKNWNLCHESVKPPAHLGLSDPLKSCQKIEIYAWLSAQSWVSTPVLRITRKTEEMDGEEDIWKAGPPLQQTKQPLQFKRRDNSDTLNRPSRVWRATHGDGRQRIRPIFIWIFATGR
jgi:hypothetical protein